MIYWFIILIASLYVLAKASDFFLEAAEAIGDYFRIPHFIQGVTLVALGTSLPELLTSILSVTAGSSEIVTGNVVGSNITNIFFIIGVAILMSTNLTLKVKNFYIDYIVFAGLSALLIWAIADGDFGGTEALLFTILIPVYIAYLIGFHPEEFHAQDDFEQKNMMVALLVFVFSGIALYAGAKFTVQSAIELATRTGIGTEVIALSIVSLGTSLPELAVTIAASKKGKSSIVIGNIIGSNIFNTLAVMGIPGMMAALVIPNDMAAFSLPVMATASLLFVSLAFFDRVPRAIGLLFIGLYFFFIAGIYLELKLPF